MQQQHIETLMAVNEVTTALINRTCGNSRNTAAMFVNSVNSEWAADGRSVTININLKDGNIHSIAIPVPFTESGVDFIEINGTKRALCKFYDPFNGVQMSIVTAIKQSIIALPKGITQMNKLKHYPLVQEIAFAIVNGEVTDITNRITKIISEIVSKMPLHKTNFMSWVANHQLIIIDPEFDEIRNPEDLLEYQAKKNKEMWPSCSSIGISDQSMAQNNYTLFDCDLRDLMPLGRISHASRNQSNTTGMEGRELPKILSQKEKELEMAGISRSGYNLLTAFIDIVTPNGVSNFQDLILVDNSLLGNYVEHDKNVLVFNKPTIKAGDQISFGSDLTLIEKFETHCESAIIKSITPIKTIVGGIEKQATKITVTYRRYFKNGFKFTNRSANKGIIRFVDLGYTINPATGQQQKLQVVCSSKNVLKRQNWGQAVEAVLSCIYDTIGDTEAEVVTPMDWTPTNQDLSNMMVESGYRADGTWTCYIPDVQPIEAVVGEVFWGVIKTPEDQIWEEEENENENAFGKRTTGVKFSVIETASTFAMWGKNNAVFKEVFSYQQGLEDIQEYKLAIESRLGIIDQSIEIIDIADLKVVDQSASTMVPKDAIEGTVADKKIYPKGIYMRLPLTYRTSYFDGEVAQSGSADNDDAIFSNYDTDLVYIPASRLRKAWAHPAKVYGLNNIAAMLNNIIEEGQSMVSNGWLTVTGPDEVVDNDKKHTENNYYTSITRYFDFMAMSLSGKKGVISSSALSVRYPWSVKGVACQITGLPKNTVMIHRSMADILKVTDGDVVMMERFPCLGFMSLRPQYVKVTEDEIDRYVIYANGQDLGSTGLDFDGDTLYIYAFHTEAAKALLKKALTEDTPFTRSIEKLNNVKGAPAIITKNWQELGYNPLPPMSAEKHDTVIRKMIGVKADTGPVINLVYNLFRLVETSKIKFTDQLRADLGEFMEKAGQSVFEQKHGSNYSLCHIVKEGIYSGNEALLIKEGFNPTITKLLCDTVKAMAATIGVPDIGGAYYQKNKKKFDIVSKIISIYNSFYVVSRRSMPDALKISNELNDVKIIDLPSYLYVNSVKGTFKIPEQEMDELKRKVVTTYHKKVSM